MKRRSGCDYSNIGLRQMIGENIGINLMLLDINMPQMNGFEVLEIMKRSQCIDETPVIMISSEESLDAMRKA